GGGGERGGRACRSRARARVTSRGCTVSASAPPPIRSCWFTRRGPARASPRARCWPRGGSWGGGVCMPSRTCCTTSSRWSRRRKGRSDDRTSGMAARLRHCSRHPVQRRRRGARGAVSGAGRAADFGWGATARPLRNHGRSRDPHARRTRARHRANGRAGPRALTLARETNNIVAVKEASGDLAQIMAILRDRPPGFRVLSGDDAVTLPLIALGADGIVSVVSNEAPDLMVRLTDSALSGEWDSARDLHYRLLPLMEANFIESSPGPVKAALALMGLLDERFRLPLVPVPEQTRARLRVVLGALGLM